MSLLSWLIKLQCRSWSAAMLFCSAVLCDPDPKPVADGSGNAGSREVRDEAIALGGNAKEIPKAICYALNGITTAIEGRQETGIPASIDLRRYG